MLYEEVLTIMFADEAQVFDHSSERSLGVLSCSAVVWYSPLPCWMRSLFTPLKCKFTWQYQGNASIIISTDVSGAF